MAEFGDGCGAQFETSGLAALRAYAACGVVFGQTGSRCRAAAFRAYLPKRGALRG